MKWALFFKVSILTLAISAVLAPNAFAAGGSHKGSIQISDPIQVNGKNLPAGEYTVTWSGEGNAVNLNFARGGKVLATAAANVVSLDAKSSDNIYELKTSSTGGKELSALRFSGQKIRLEIAGSGDQGKVGDSVK